MKYKGYELVIDLEEDGSEIVITIPSLNIKQHEYNIPGSKTIGEWFKDQVDLHIGRSAERETCEKRIDPEEVAKAIYTHNWTPSCPGPFEGLDVASQDHYRKVAAAAIACIKKIDPSIVSDDINHGVKHKFDREVMAEMICDSAIKENNRQGYGINYTYHELSDEQKNIYRAMIDSIISYVEMVIYG